MTAKNTPAEIPITVRVQTVQRDGYAIDFGEDADGRYTFAVLLQPDFPQVWCFGHPAGCAIANMANDDENFLSHLGSDKNEEEELLAEIMLVAFRGTVVNEPQAAALRAQHYPHPLRDAVHKALIAAWLDGYGTVDVEPTTVDEFCNANVARLLAEIPW
jgi:hypothetical protein